MLYGLQASQDVKLSNIARSLQEKIPLIKTEDRSRLPQTGSARVGSNTVLCLGPERRAQGVCAEDGVSGHRVRRQNGPDARRILAVRQRRPAKISWSHCWSGDCAS